jgi:hypothetical protein
MDQAWRAHGMKSRMEFFRGAISHCLAHLGAADAAALFGNSSAPDARGSAFLQERRDGPGPEAPRVRAIPRLFKVLEST